MRIKTAKVSDPNSFVSNPGSDIHILYKSKINPKGEIILTEYGKESISEKINAQKEFTDMEYIRSRIAAGDMSVMKDPGVYADVTKLPKTLAESLQIRIDAEHAFYQLPVDVRNKFNNNFNLWLMEAGSNEWNDKMGFVKEVEEKIEEVIDNEQKQ